MTEKVRYRGGAMEQVVDGIARSHHEGCFRVAVDGVDGAGKTVFADELAVRARAHGLQIVRVSIDDFHKKRAERYRLGRNSPDGFWLDSYDYDAFLSMAIAPFGSEGSRRYRRASHDLMSDSYVTVPPEEAPSGAVLIVDGIFLHRDELVHAWDMSVFLHVPFEVSVPRMAVRDGSNPSPDHSSNRRYVDGQRIYFAECSPWLRATMVVDNSAPYHPRVMGAEEIALLSADKGS